MNVLLLGVQSGDRHAIQAALDISAPHARVGRADHWSEVPPGTPFGVIVVGGDTAEAAWEALGQVLQREAPQATLVAVPEDPHVRIEGDWHDVVFPDERSDATWRRVVRHALRLHDANDRLARWGLRDPLTDVLNRRGLERVLQQLASDRERGVGPLSVALVDVDDFKHVNDLLGMAGGDQVLREVARAVRDQVREGDAVARVGGDEFLVLLPRARTWEAVEVAERIRQAVARVEYVDGESVTVSIGVQRLTDETRELEPLLRATQAGLRTSKEVGKNQVHVSSGTHERATSLVEFSLPPGRPLVAFHDELWCDSHGRPRRVVRRPDLPPPELLQLSMQRAVQAPWDLHWLSAGAQRGPHRAHPTLPVLLRLYPATLAQTTATRILDQLHDRLAPQQLGIDIDEQFLSGDPSVLLPTLDALRDAGVKLCLSVAEPGIGCLESLVVLRPDIVHLDGGLVQAAMRSRTRRAQLHRFIHAVEALELRLAVSGLQSEREALAARRFGFTWVGRVVAEKEPTPSAA